MSKQPYNSEAHQLVAMDRASVTAVNFEKNIIHGTFVANNPELRKLADAIGNKLGEFYQAIGNTDVTPDSAWK